MFSYICVWEGFDVCVCVCVCEILRNLSVITAVEESDGRDSSVVPKTDRDRV